MKLLAKGVGASPGTATGCVVFRSEDAVELAATGASVIFIRNETTAEDVPGMRASAGVVTTRGGITGDAAIVARTLGKPCIASCSSMRVDYSKDLLAVWQDSGDAASDVIVRKGDTLTIDGTKGEFWIP